MDSSTFIAALRERYLELSPHMAECGLTIRQLSADSATLELPSREDWLGDVESGRFNPGIVSVLVDNSAGLAVIAHAGRRDAIATLDLRLDYLRPAFIGSPLFCRARCTRMTPSIAFAHAVVWQDNEAAPIATAQGVFMRSGANRVTGGDA
ncbi:PaaI family thioesterase [Solimonas terrae]|uniref:PaaI family thioesterase n=1 Tax=Solimonas terrae TaxID=1396819 RepID=A0A6M2BV55_9GAMM|nr:PaaI family thioesterase [Solimonas terrae]NGY06125.1 PaaI family thioesterase [Solimonas terrae]